MNTKNLIIIVLSNRNTLDPIFTDSLVLFKNGLLLPLFINFLGFLRRDLKFTGKWQRQKGISVTPVT